MPGVFAQAGMGYAYENDGVGFEQFAKVAYKNHLHSPLTPLAQYQKEFSLDEIMGAPVMSYPNTLLMCCPTGDGAAAAVLVSGERLKSMPKKVTVPVLTALATVMVVASLKSLSVSTRRANSSVFAQSISLMPAISKLMVKLPVSSISETFHVRPSR